MHWQRKWVWQRNSPLIAYVFVDPYSGLGLGGERSGLWWSYMVLPQEREQEAGKLNGRTV